MSLPKFIFLEVMFKKNTTEITNINNISIYFSLTTETFSLLVFLRHDSEPRCMVNASQILHEISKIILHQNGNMYRENFFFSTTKIE